MKKKIKIQIILDIETLKVISDFESRQILARFDNSALLLFTKYINFSENSNYWWESLLKVFQKFVDNDQQCFAFTPQPNFPAHNLNFHRR